MKKKLVTYIFALIFLLSCATSFANDQKEDFESKKQTKLLGVLQKELQLARKVSKLRKDSDPRLLYRIIEIQSEILKIVRDTESKNFLKLPVEERLKKDKKEFFQQSTKLYRSIQKMGGDILKRYNQFSSVADLYLTLALNTIDFNEKTNVENYLLNAIEKSPQDSKTRKAAYTAIADFYYNEKRYEDAIKYYQYVLRYTNDEWWTKYAYNLSWCYLKSGNYDNAINLAKKVVELSENKKYINIKDQVLGQIHNFYVLALRIREGVDYLKAYSKGNPEYLIKISKSAMNKGFFDDGDYGLKTAYSLVDPKSVVGAEVNLTALELYSEYKKVDHFVRKLDGVFLDFNNKLLKGEMLERFNLQLKNNLADWQKEIQNKDFKVLDESLKFKLEGMFKNLKILLKTDPKETPMYYFQISELYFFKHEYELAMKHYHHTFKISKKYKKDQTFKKNTVDAMIATVAVSKLDEKYLIIAYRSYLSVSPADEKAKQIYPRLFNIYYKQNKPKHYENVIEFYKKNFPNDLKEQQEMVIKTMEKLRLNKDVENYTRWAYRVEKGEFKFDLSFIQQSIMVLGDMLFAKTSKLLSEGAKEEALKNFISYYQHPQFSREIKEKSSFNAAVLYLEFKQHPEATLWLEKWYEQVLDKEKEKEAQKLVDFSTTYFYRRDFSNAAILASKNLARFCNKSNKLKDGMYVATVIYNLAINKNEQALLNFEKYKDCEIPLQVYSNVAKEMYTAFKRDGSVKNLSRLEDSIKIIPGLGTLFLEKNFTSYLELQIKGNKAESNKYKEKILTDYKNAIAKKEEVSPFLKGMPAYFELETFELDISKFKQTALEFPEVKFNEIIQKKLLEVSQLTDSAAKISKQGFSFANIKIYFLLADAYQSFANQIKEFTPPGKDAEYVDGFKKAMSPVVTTMETKSKEFLFTGKKEIENNSFLSKENFSFLPRWDFSLPMDYLTLLDDVIMDRNYEK